MRMIDLCCGIGGIRRGFELAGEFENVLSAEKDEYACRTYEHLFGDNAENDVILSILVYTFFSRMFDLMLPPVAKHSIVVA